jgi:hypothetical protein
MDSLESLNGRNSASTPSACNTVANASPASSWQPEITTRLPPFAKANAAARPMPVKAPVGASN